jgi:predicted membrane metal-binding protein
MFTWKHIVWNLVSSFVICMAIIYVLSQKVNFWMPILVVLVLSLLYMQL